jgi:PST family polysaccharide transporter
MGVPPAHSAVSRSSKASSPSTTDDADLVRQTVTGLGWMGPTRVAQRVAQFAFSVVLARLLVPEDFGLIALITVFTGFLGVFADLGFASALIQRRDVEERHLSSALGLNIAVGFTLTCLVAALAPALAAFYNEPRLLPLTFTVAPSFLLESMGGVQTSLLVRGMDFKRLAAVETAGLLTSNGIAVGMALAGAGVWSLVAPILVSPMVRSALLWSVRSWRPRVRPDRSSIAELWGFSSRLAGFSALNYWARNADNLLIGRFIGTRPLAYYSRAYNLMFLPIDLVYAGPMRVMYPALSRLQEDHERVKRIYLRGIALISLFTFPTMVGLGVICRPFVLTVFGAKWAPVVTILEILCIPGFIQSVSGTTGWIFYSQGRTDRFFHWGIYSTASAIAAFFIGLPWGVRGVAIAYACWSLLITYPLYRIAGALIGMSVREVAQALRGTAFTAFLMGLIVWGVERLAPSGWGTGGQLALGIATGIVAYVGLLHLIAPASYRDLRLLITRLRFPSSHNTA